MNKNNIFLGFLPSKKPAGYKSKPELNSLTQTNSSSFEEKKKFLFEFNGKSKQNTITANILTPSNQTKNHNYLSFAKNTSESSSKAYLLTNIKNETMNTEPSTQISKNSGNCCVIQINIQKEKIRFNVDCINKTSEWLVTTMLKKIQEAEENDKKGEISRKPIIGFLNTSGFTLIDYILTLKNAKLDFLQNMIMVFKPIYGDIHLIRAKTNRQSLKHFEFLKLIGSGGFSKVFLGIFITN